MTNRRILIFDIVLTIVWAALAIAQFIARNTTSFSFTLDFFLAVIWAIITGYDYVLYKE